MTQDKTRIAFEAWWKTEMDILPEGSYADEQWVAFSNGALAHAAETEALIEELAECLKQTSALIGDYREIHGGVANAREQKSYVEQRADQALHRVEAYRGKE